MRWTAAGAGVQAAPGPVERVAGTASGEGVRQHPAGIADNITGTVFATCTSATTAAANRTSDSNAANDSLSSLSARDPIGVPVHHWTVTDPMKPCTEHLKL